MQDMKMMKDLFVEGELWGWQKKKSTIETVCMARDLNSLGRFLELDREKKIDSAGTLCAKGWVTIRKCNYSSATTRFVFPRFPEHCYI